MLLSSTGEAEGGGEKEKEGEQDEERRVWVREVRLGKRGGPLLSATLKQSKLRQELQC